MYKRQSVEKAHGTPVGDNTLYKSVGLPLALLKAWILQGFSGGGTDASNLEIDWDATTRETIYGSDTTTPVGLQLQYNVWSANTNLISGKSFDSYDAFQIRMGNDRNNIHTSHAQPLHWYLELSRDNQFIVNTPSVGNHTAIQRRSATSFRGNHQTNNGAYDVIQEIIGIKFKYKDGDA